MAEEAVARQGRLALAISTAVVGELASTTGRGPTQAKTTLRDNAVFVVLQDTLTRGERTLVGAGESEAVLDLRRRWQRVMRESCSKKIEGLMGRRVVGFMSDNHIDPTSPSRCSSSSRSELTPQPKRRSRWPSRWAGERVPIDGEELDYGRRSPSHTAR